MGSAVDFAEVITADSQLAHERPGSPTVKIPFFYKDDIRRVWITQQQLEVRIERQARVFVDYWCAEAEAGRCVFPLRLVCVLKGSNRYFQTFLRNVDHLYEKRIDRVIAEQVVAEDATALETAAGEFATPNCYSSPFYVEGYLRMKSYHGTEAGEHLVLADQLISQVSEILTAQSAMDLVFFEDIVETGRTLSIAIHTLADHLGPNVRSVSVMAMLYKVGTSVPFPLSDFAFKNDAQKPTYDPKLALITQTPKRALEYFSVGYVIHNFFVIGYGLDVDERYRDLPHLCEFKL